MTPPNKTGDISSEDGSHTQSSDTFCACPLLPKHSTDRGHAADSSRVESASNNSHLPTPVAPPLTQSSLTGQTHPSILSSAEEFASSPHSHLPASSPTSSSQLFITRQVGPSTRSSATNASTSATAPSDLLCPPQASASKSSTSDLKAIATDPDCALLKQRVKARLEAREAKADRLDAILSDDSTFTPGRLCIGDGPDSSNIAEAPPSQSATDMPPKIDLPKTSIPRTAPRSSNALANAVAQSTKYYAALRRAPRPGDSLGHTVLLQPNAKLPAPSKSPTAPSQPPSQVPESAAAKESAPPSTQARPAQLTEPSTVQKPVVLPAWPPPDAKVSATDSTLETPAQTTSRAQPSAPAEKSTSPDTQTRKAPLPGPFSKQERRIVALRATSSPAAFNALSALSNRPPFVSSSPIRPPVKPVRSGVAIKSGGHSGGLSQDLRSQSNLHKFASPSFTPSSTLSATPHTTMFGLPSLENHFSMLEATEGSPFGQVAKQQGFDDTSPAAWVPVCHLLKMPPEIKNQILLHVIPVDKDARKKQSFPPITHVNRELRNIAMPVYLANNDFSVDTREVLVKEVEAWSALFAGLHDNHKKSFRRLTVVYDTMLVIKQSYSHCHIHHVVYDEYWPNFQYWDVIVRQLQSAGLQPKHLDWVNERSSFTSSSQSGFRTHAGNTQVLSQILDDHGKEVYLFSKYMLPSLLRMHGLYDNAHPLRDLLGYAMPLRTPQDFTDIRVYQFVEKATSQCGLAPELWFQNWIMKDDEVAISYEATDEVIYMAEQALSARSEGLAGGAIGIAGWNGKKALAERRRIPHCAKCTTLFYAAP